MFKSLATALLSAVANIFGWSKQRSEVKNAVDVKKAVTNQQEVNAVEKLRKDIAGKNIEEVRNEISE